MTPAPQRAAPGTWRIVAAIAATYVFFLLFAQFGLLATLRDELPRAGVDAAMAAMGLSGLATSLAMGAALKRLSLRSGVAAGLLACALCGLAAPAAHGAIPLAVLAGLTGIATAVLTVSLAAGLRDWVPAARRGRVVGLGTGIAYAICNIPALFTAAPNVRAVVPALLCAAAGILVRGHRTAADAGDEATERAGLWAGLLAFVALVGLDSAAFALIQQSPDLNARAWGTDGLRMAQGAVHFLAAVAAGALLDRARFRGVLWSAFALLAGGIANIAAQGATGGALYAAGVSFYSVALVTFPSMAGGGSTRWRAALTYGIAGWLGSAVGVGLAQHVDQLPLTAILAAAALIAAGGAIGRRAAWRGWAAPAAGVLASALCAWAMRAQHPVARATDIVARGRAVYMREGCINCHSQFVRPFEPDLRLWGPARGYDRSERPPLIGNRRQGPDLQNVGVRRPAQWHDIHLRNPALLTPGSRMPAYEHLFADGNPDGPALVAYLSSLGVAPAPAGAAP